MPVLSDTSRKRKPYSWGSQLSFLSILSIAVSAFSLGYWLGHGGASCAGGTCQPAAGGDYLPPKSPLDDLPLESGQSTWQGGVDAASVAARGKSQGQEFQLPLQADEEKLQATAAAAGRQQQGPPLQFAGRIPKILHTVFIPDLSKPENAKLKMWPHHELWVQGCLYHFSPAAGWRHMYWDAAASEALIADHYPWFLEFYQMNITLANEKSDIIRYLLMHKYGGLYLDSDTDCWREAGDTLEGADVVLQGTHGGEGVGSAALASVPGAPVWLKTLELLQDRRPSVSSWERSLDYTGPNLLADSLIAVGLKANRKKMFKRLHKVDGLVYQINKGGTWFLACQWWDDECRGQVYVQRASGQTDLRTVVGMHRFAGSWIPGKEDGKGIPNVMQALCPKPKRRRIPAP